jgi:hypothetical protein
VFPQLSAKSCGCVHNAGQSRKLWPAFFFIKPKTPAPARRTPNGRLVYGQGESTELRTTSDGCRGIVLDRPPQPSSLAWFGRRPIGGAINCAACRQRGLNGGVHERVVDRPDGR